MQAHEALEHHASDEQVVLFSPKLCITIHEVRSRSLGL